MPRRDALPKRFSTPEAARRRNLTIITVIVLTALSAPGALFLASRANSTASAAASQAQGDGVMHQAFAETVARRWAYGTGYIVAATGPWDTDVGRPALTAEQARGLGLSPALADTPTGQGDMGVVHLAWDSATIRNVGEHFIELHRFLVTTRTGMFWLTVPVTETSAGPTRPALGGNPTIEPFLIDPDVPLGPVIWPEGFERQDPTGNVVDIAIEWAQAYVQDDHRALFRLARQTDESIVYRGLGSFDLVDATIGPVALRGDGRLMVRASLTMTNRYGVMLRSDYDLLLEQHTEPVPAVVSWGARGTGPDLTPGSVTRAAGTEPVGGYGSWLDDHTDGTFVPPTDAEPADGDDGEVAGEPRPSRSDEGNTDG